MENIATENGYLEFDGYSYPDPRENSLVDNYERIRSPGKFQGEAYYIPWYWDHVLDGGADCELEDENGNLYAIMAVHADDRIRFHIPADVTEIWLHEREDGFVQGMEMTSEAAAVTRSKMLPEEGE